MEEFNPLELQEENDCTLESICLEYLETSPVILPEKENLLCSSVLRSQKRTSRGKLKTSIDFTQEQQLLKILKVNSIPKKEVSYLFWTEYILKESKKLLSCKRKYCVDLVLNSWSSSANRLLAGSRFTTKPTLMNKMFTRNSLETSCPSSLFLATKTMDYELVGTEKDDENSKKTKKIKEPAEKCKKIRLYPNESQRIILNN
jgi:hypothetical protein